MLVRKYSTARNNNITLSESEKVIIKHTFKEKKHFIHELEQWIKQQFQPSQLQLVSMCVVWYKYCNQCSKMYVFLYAHIIRGNNINCNIRTPSASASSSALCSAEGRLEAEPETFPPFCVVRTEVVDVWLLELLFRCAILWDSEPEQCARKA